MTRNNDSEDVRYSKALSYILRHGAQKEGLKSFRSDGFVRVDEILTRPKLRGLNLELLQHVVESNEKQRFKLIEEEGVFWIRANQGHSLSVEKLELVKITDPTQLPLVIHGTRQILWEVIYTQGLSIMNRTHIHCATGLAGDDKVISGMRKSCDLFIYIDVAKAMADGIDFVQSANGVILTNGVDGILTCQYFARVIRKDGTVIFPIETGV